VKFSRDNLMAQGAQWGSRSVYLSGFSYATLLSAANLTLNRYLWTTMTDSEWDEIDALVSKMTEELFLNAMIGTIVAYVGDVIPETLLLCDGGTYDREDYPDLYDVLPVSLHVGADSFTVPDMAGRAAVGATIALPLLSTFGSEAHTLTIDEIPSHAHTYTPPIPNVDLETPGAPDLLAAGVGPSTLTGSAGGGAAHNNLPPSIALYWCVVAR
jgi:microcystin-dependent protein